MISAGQVLEIGLAIQKADNLRVPEYQRNYNWERENVEDFWGDLLESHRTQQDHFFGSLILESHGDDGAVSEVVDGQQRLTTFFVLLARLRDELVRIDPTGRVEEGGESFSLLDELNKFLGKHPSSIKYRPNSLILEVFEDICKTPRHDYGENQLKIKQDFEGREIRQKSEREDAAATLPLRNTYFRIKQLVRKHLEEVSFSLPPDQANQAKVKEIYQLSQTARTRFKVLPISTNSQRESLEVFLTTNDRGMDLGVMDLVRGQILEAQLAVSTRSADRGELLDRHADSMRKISTSVGTTQQIDQFLRHWLHSHPNTVTKDKDEKLIHQRLTMRAVPDFTKGIIGKGAGSDTRASDLWRFIRKGAALYPEVVEPESGDNRTRLRLLALKSVAASYRIFAFKVFDPSIQLSLSSKSQLIDSLARLVFKWFLSGGNAQDLEIFLHQQVHILKSDESVPLVESNFAKELAAREVGEEDLNLVVNSESWTRGILFLIEADLAGKGGVITKYQVEHIAPQSPTEDWMDSLGTDSRKDYKNWISNLGNLTLLDGPTNNELDREPFVVKKKAYGESQVRLALEVSKLPDSHWDTASIEARSETLRSHLRRILG